MFCWVCVGLVCFVAFLFSFGFDLWWFLVYAAFVYTLVWFWVCVCVLGLRFGFVFWFVSFAGGFSGLRCV